MRRKPTVIDLFAGAGLLSYAFEREGFEVRIAIEQDRRAAETYVRNLDAHVVIGDIERVRPTGKCDVIVAGPPCQGFSTLGKRNRNDPRNSLSLCVADWASVLRPRAVVIENVAAFLQSPTWNQLARRLERLGYSVRAHILDAAKYGSPQRRRRSFTIASRIGQPSSIPRVLWRTPETVREAWKGLSSQPDNTNSHCIRPPSPLALARMKVIPPGGDKRDVMRHAAHLTPPSWWKVSGDVTDVWGRMEWEQPSNTIRTVFINPSKGRYIHPEQDRVISLREGARLQSIPDSWAFVGLPCQVSRQIGNSVPQTLGRAVARAVRGLF